MEMDTLRYTRQQLAKAWKSGQIAGIAEGGLLVRFLLINGLESGYLVNNDQSIKRFECENLAWQEINELKSRK